MARIPAPSVSRSTSTSSTRKTESDNALSKKTYTSNETQAKSRASLEDNMASLKSDRSDAQKSLDKWSGTASRGGHAGRNAKARVKTANDQIKDLDPKIADTQTKLDGHPAPASDAQKFRHNQMVEKYESAGGGHAGRNKRNALSKDLNASQTKISGLESKEASSAKATAKADGAKTETTAKAGETRELDAYQRGGTIGRASQLKTLAKSQKATAKDKIADASDKMEGTVKNAVADGQLRRSEQLELVSKDMEFKAAGSDLKAANQLGKQADAMKSGAADGKMTAAEQGKIDKHQGKRQEHLGDAKALRSDAKALKGEAEVARNDELKGDISALKERREANLPGIKEEYRTALKDYQGAVQEAGGYRAVREMEAGPEKDRITGLKMKKDGAFKAVQASNKSGAMIRSAEEAMADGKVSTTEQSGIDKQVKQINAMYSESDDLKTMGSMVQSHANTALATKAVQSGDVKSLFTKPWGKEFMANAMQQQMMMQMGYPMMNPGMMQNPMQQQMMQGGGFGRNMFDMQQQMMMMPGAFGGGGMDMFNQFGGGFPFGSGMDFSRFGQY